MADVTELDEVLDGAFVEDAVFALRPDYRVLLVAADGIASGPSDPASEALLLRGGGGAAGLLAGVPGEELPPIAAWRDASRGFGAKPQRPRNSLEALPRRAAAGLPRINRITDVYN